MKKVIKMTKSFPLPKGADITQYEHIQCTRPKDGLEMRAHRIIADEQTPVSWTVAVEGKSEKSLTLQRNNDGTLKTYSTSELIKLAKDAGFGEWQQSAIAMREGTITWEGKDIEALIPQYQIPDPTIYPKEINDETR
jgi:hypothetical protein